MRALAMVLLAAARASTPPAPSEKALKTEVEQLFRDADAGRLAVAHSRFARRLQRRVGPIQLDAFFDGRRRALGPFVSVEGLVASSGPSGSKTDGVSREARLRFRDGVVSGTFAFAHERGAWRLLVVTVGTPAGKAGAMDDASLPVIVREVLDLAVREGVVALVDRMGEEARKEGGEAQARADAQRMAQLMGRLIAYSPVRTAESESAECRVFTTDGRFEKAAALLTVSMCWKDGLWELWAIRQTVEMTPALAARTLPGVLAKQFSMPADQVVVSCPQVAWAVGTEITCRATFGGSRRFDLRVSRPTASKCLIVGATEVE